MATSRCDDRDEEDDRHSSSAAVPIDRPHTYIRPLAPDRGVVYRHHDAAGVLLYVGSTTVLAMRRRQLCHGSSARWWRFVVRVEHEEHENRRAALDAERAEIHAATPIFNRNRPGGIEEHEAREFAYLAAHSCVPDWWGPKLRSLRKLDPVTRRAHVDVLLSGIGVPV